MDNLKTNLTSLKLKIEFAENKEIHNLNTKCYKELSEILKCKTYIICNKKKKLFTILEKFEKRGKLYDCVR